MYFIHLIHFSFFFSFNENGITIENVLHEKPYDRVTRREKRRYTWLRIVRGIGSRKAYSSMTDRYVSISVNALRSLFSADLKFKSTEGMLHIDTRTHKHIRRVCAASSRFRLDRPKVHTSMQTLLWSQRRLVIFRRGGKISVFCKRDGEFSSIRRDFCRLQAISVSILYPHEIFM